MSESMPPPTSGGNGKFVVVGLLLLLLGGAGAWFVMKPEPPPPAAPTPPVAVAPTPPPPDPGLYIPPAIPDAGPVPDAGGPAKVKRIIKYVNAGGDGGDFSECNGEVARAAAARVVSENRAQLRSCYERGLKRKNALQGSVRITLKVGRSGSVEGTKIGGSLSDAEVFSCMRGIASRWRFPAPTGGSCAVVEAPFNFSPQQ